jgi:hypothetical protein
MSGFNWNMALGGASVLTLTFGAVYLADCRFTGGERESCYLTAAGYLGIGATAGGAYKAGLWRPNPALTDEQRRAAPPIDRPLE